MTIRASFEVFKERLEPGAWVADLEDSANFHVGSCYDQNFAKDFKNLKPAVWFLAQSGYSLGNEENLGYAGEFRQRTRIEVVMRLVIKRVVDGRYNNEDEMNLLFKAVVNRLFAWIPPEAEGNVFYVAHEDGPPNESLITCDLVVGYIVVKDG